MSSTRSASKGMMRHETDACMHVHGQSGSEQTMAGQTAQAGLPPTRKNRPGGGCVNTWQRERTALVNTRAHASVLDSAAGHTRTHKAPHIHGKRNPHPGQSKTFGPSLPLWQLGRHTSVCLSHTVKTRAPHSSHWQLCISQTRAEQPSALAVMQQLISDGSKGLPVIDRQAAVGRCCHQL